MLTKVHQPRAKTSLLSILSSHVLSYNQELAVCEIVNLQKVNGGAHKLWCGESGGMSVLGTHSGGNIL
jgi:hypothetical protein